MRFQLQCVGYICLCTIVIVAKSAGDTKRQASPKRAKEDQTDHEQLTKTINKLEDINNVLQKKIVYLEDDVRALEVDNKDYQRNIELGLKDYANIYLENREMEKSTQHCEVEKEKLNSRLAKHMKLKKKLEERVEGFGKELEDMKDLFGAEESVAAWSALSGVYTECFISMVETEASMDEAGNCKLKDRHLEHIVRYKEAINNATQLKHKCELDMAVVRKKITQGKSELKKCQSQYFQGAAPKIECEESDENCPKALREEEEKAIHYIEQFRACKNEKQNHKVLKWFMAKELVGLKEQRMSLNNNLTAALDEKSTLESELKSKTFKIDNNSQALSRTSRDLDTLGKDHITLQNNLEELKSTHHNVQTELYTCKNDKQHAEYMRKEAELAMKENDSDDIRIKREIADLKVQLEEAIHGAEIYSMYFAACVIIIFCIVIVQLYLLGKRWFEDYQERLKEEKTTQKRENREIKSRRRKPKIQ